MREELGIGRYHTRTNYTLLLTKENIMEKDITYIDEKGVEHTIIYSQGFIWNITIEDEEEEL